MSYGSGAGSVMLAVIIILCGMAIVAFIAHDHWSRKP